MSVNFVVDIDTHLMTNKNFQAIFLHESKAFTSIFSSFMRINLALSVMILRPQKVTNTSFDFYTRKTFL